MTAKKTEFIVTDLISKIFQRKTIMDKLPSQRELAEIYHVFPFHDPEGAGKAAIHWFDLYDTG